MTKNRTKYSSTKLAIFASAIVDVIIGTIRYGNASQIDSKLGTGGNNLDMPGLNPIKYYNVLQMDVTRKF